jgi:chromosome segregation ATPase
MSSYEDYIVEHLEDKIYKLASDFEDHKYRMSEELEDLRNKIYIISSDVEDLKSMISEIQENLPKKECKEEPDTIIKESELDKDLLINSLKELKESVRRLSVSLDGMD